MRNRLTDRHASVRRMCIVSGGRVDGTTDYGLGRAVFVDQPGMGREGLPTGQRSGRQRFATDHHHRRVQRCWMVGQLLAQHFQMRRCELDHAQRSRIAQALPQGVEGVVVGQQFDLRTAQQRSEQTGQRGVEGQRRGHHRAGLRPIGFDGPLQVMRGTRMREQGALGLAGGTGGVDDVGQIVRTQAGNIRRAGIIVLSIGNVVQGQHADAQHGATGWEMILQIGAGQHCARAAVLQQEGQAFAGQFRIQRHIRRAGLERGKHRDHLLDAARQVQGDSTLQADTGTA